MELAIVMAVAAGASALTLISGFGLGTLLLPAFALLFPVEVAVVATAVVHLANNLFKLMLVGQFAERRVVLRFGLPAAGAALVGAGLLAWLTLDPFAFALEVNEYRFETTGTKIVIGLMIFAFAIGDLRGRAETPGFFAGRFALGGVISGFFGGLSGHQGALRSAVLITSGLTKEQFIGTGTACAVLIDIARLSTYTIAGASIGFAAIDSSRVLPVVAAMAAAFVGAYIGRRLMDRVTLTHVRRLVGAMLLIVGIGLAAGLL